VIIVKRSKERKDLQAERKKLLGKNEIEKGTSLSKERSLRNLLIRWLMQGQENSKEKKKRGNKPWGVRFD